MRPGRLPRSPAVTPPGLGRQPRHDGIHTAPPEVAAPRTCVSTALGALADRTQPAPTRNVGTRDRWGRGSWGRGGWDGSGRGPVAGDAGMVTVFTVLAALALLLMVGLVVDGADRLRALGRADRVAAEAARAGAEAADTRGPVLVLDPPAARAAAAAYLRAAGVTGTVTVTGPRTVTVVVTVTGTDLILGLVGPGTYAVTGSAQARLSVGVTTGDGG